MPKLSVVGWIKLVLSAVLAIAGVWAEAGGHVPDGVGKAAAAVATIFTAFDTSAGRAAVKAGR